MQFVSQNRNNKIAIIAGTGDLPLLLLKSLPQRPQIISFHSDINPQIPADLLVNLAQIGRVVKFLRAHKIEQLVFAGGISRPKILQLRPDFVGLKLLFKTCWRTMFCKLAGDHALFSAMSAELAKHGIALVGAHEIAPELLAQNKCYSQLQPSAAQLRSIEIGFAAAKQLGEADLGQAVLVANAEVVAHEDARGTAAMLADWLGKFAPADNAVLVKCKKPQQDTRIDLPSIGPETIAQAKAAGLCGIALEAGAALLIDAQKCSQLADENGIFLLGT